MRDKLSKFGKKPLEKYARFVVHRALIVLVLIFLFTLFTGYQASMMETVGTSQKDWLPEDIEVVETFELISDQFAGSFSKTTISVQIDPRYARSEEIRDVRDPEVLRYVDLLSKRAKLVYGVVSAKSAADVIKDANDGRIPGSLRSVKSLLEKDEKVDQRMDNYISDDYSMSLVRLDILDDVDTEEVVGELRDVILIKKPQGVSVELTGGPVIEVAMQELAQETMDLTSFVSFALIILILIILFTSVKYGLIPLLTIVFGLIWATGTLVLVGFEITPQTSGVMAMIMGIGIDFGIQVTKRFRYELQTQKREEAMVDTIKNVFYPMTITTIAAVIGFKCLSLGELPVMEDMGTMMATGVIFCMVAALTVVPAVLVLFERENKKPRDFTRLAQENEAGITHERAYV